MKRKIVSLFIMFLCVATLIGCIGAPESTLEETLDDYISYYNAGEFNKIYDELLSAEVKEEYSKDEFYNMNSISEAAFHIDDYEITDRIEENNSVILTVNVSWNV